MTGLAISFLHVPSEDDYEYDDEMQAQEMKKKQRKIQPKELNLLKPVPQKEYSKWLHEYYESLTWRNIHDERRMEDTKKLTQDISNQVVRIRLYEFGYQSKF